MNKSLLVVQVHQRLPKKYTASQIKQAVDVFFDELKKGITSDERVELRGFGSFSLRTHSAKLAYHPKTGQRFYIPSRKVTYFRASSKITDKLNKKQ